MRSGEEIQAALRRFAAKWAGFRGGERAEAQTFLNELVDCYGLDRQAAGMLFEHYLPGAGYLDMFWPGKALVEMKGPGLSASLESAQPQAERYWRLSEDPDGAYDAVRYVVLCSFNRFLVWDMRRPSRPSANLTLDELPDHYEALGFLVGEGQEASFVEHHRELTLDAAKAMSLLYHSLKDRDAAPPEQIQSFVLQCVWTLFAEDLGMLQGYPLQTITERLLREKEPQSARDIGFLFRVLNQRSTHNRKGELAGVRYVNGELFAAPAEVDLSHDELDLLAQAARFDWRRVDPTIFGSLMEGVLGRERRWEVGAHYTHEVDILKIVEPTIVRPWRERIDAVESPQQGRELLDELCAFLVLDPACGCGNFLYVAYRELRALEADLKSRIRMLAADQGLPVPQGAWPYVPLTNMQGIDIERAAVLIARVVLWMGHRQMIERYGEAEPPLPLVSLPGIKAADALRISWPATDCIIGNPPFLGDRRIRGALGDEYVEWLKREFGVGVVDFSAYWFRRAADHLKPGQRAGLVSTNTLSQNKHRRASLDYVVASGGVITDAVSSQKWPGEARVHVSITNWVDSPDEQPTQALLDGVAAPGITSSLRAGKDPDEALSLVANGRRAFIACYVRHPGFELTDVEAASFSRAEHEDLVVRRFLNGDDIVSRPGADPARWIIDFAERPLEEVSRRYPRELELVAQRVRPDRERDPAQMRRWWLFWRPRPEMRRGLAGCERFAGAVGTGKRLLLGWQDVATCPSHGVVVFAFDDDFSMGVLTARAHGAWAWAQASTLKGDLRYTPTSVFMTFPWPGSFATLQQREVVADASRRLLARRSDICTTEQIGLTKLYNAVDEGAWADLAALHRELDEAVADCYGWPRRVAQDDAEIVRRLTELNRDIVEGRTAYEPFGYLDERTAAST